MRLINTFFSGAEVVPFPESLTTSFDTTGIIATKNSYALKANSNTLYFSSNGGSTYPDSIAFSEGTANILGGYIFTNGNLLVYTLTKMYVSSNQLTSLVELALKDTDDSDYTIHTPANASFPGRYYNMLNIPDVQIVDGKEMILFVQCQVILRI